ncbi:NifB/NifX family molybdenum-iron cluster-binding protein [Clostridium ljungdahlii]|uniref:NifB/NifX family molybdenum-iron cluster-binding protein n=1 Tax=Clostridium ljungdahlii TaxID=1538 RepID=UPI00386E4D73
MLQWGYDCGEHEDRIENIIKSVIDCNAVLVVRAGFEPIDRLHEKGIRLFQMYQEINEGIRKAAKLLKKDE